MKTVFLPIEEVVAWVKYALCGMYNVLEEEYSLPDLHFNARSHPELASDIFNSERASEAGWNALLRLPQDSIVNIARVIERTLRTVDFGEHQHMFNAKFLNGGACVTSLSNCICCFSSEFLKSTYRFEALAEKTLHRIKKSTIVVDCADDSLVRHSVALRFPRVWRECCSGQSIHLANALQVDAVNNYGRSNELTPSRLLVEGSDGDNILMLPYMHCLQSLTVLSGLSDDALLEVGLTDLSSCLKEISNEFPKGDLKLVVRYLFLELYKVLDPPEWNSLIEWIFKYADPLFSNHYFYFELSNLLQKAIVTGDVTWAGISQYPTETFGFIPSAKLYRLCEDYDLHWSNGHEYIYRIYYFLRSTEQIDFTADSPILRYLFLYGLHNKSALRVFPFQF